MIREAFGLDVPVVQAAECYAADYAAAECYAIGPFAPEVCAVD